MVSYCGYLSCVLTVLFLARTLSLPNPSSVHCDALSYLYSEDSGDLSKIWKNCAIGDLKFPLLNYCKELLRIQQNICGLEFLKDINSGTHLETFIRSNDVQLKASENICIAFKTLNDSLYDVYIDEPDFIGKRLSEVITCHLFCNEGRQTACKVLLRMYWIWKVLKEASVEVASEPQAQQPDAQHQQVPDLTVNKPTTQSRNISSASGGNKGSGGIRKLVIPTVQDTSIPTGSSVDLTQGKSNPPASTDKHSAKPLQGKNVGTAPSTDKHSAKPLQGNNVDTAPTDKHSAKLPHDKNNESAALIDEQNEKTSLGKSNEPAVSKDEHEKTSQDKNNESTVPVSEHNAKQPQDKSDNPAASINENSAKPSQDNNNDSTASTDENKHKDLPTSIGTLKKPNDEHDGKSKTDKDINDTKPKEKSKVDENQIKHTAETKESTYSLVTKSRNDGTDQENNDEEISHDPEKISRDMIATTVGDKYQEGGSPDEPESPISDGKASQSGSSNENKSDTKTQHDDTKNKEQLPDVPQLQFPEEEDGHFFAYFLAVVVLCIAGYLVFHNKQKIIALIIEGRHERRRRPNNGTYKRLDSKDSGKATSHVVF